MGAARRLFARPGAVIGAVILVALIALALIQPGDPFALDIDRGLSELGAPRSPSLDAPLGTDALGRDVLARIAAGAATSLGIAAAATALALALGTAVGLIAGYAGGWVDRALMRLVDLVLALPFLLLAILLAALLRGSTLATSSAPIVLTLAIAGWTSIARVVRAKALALARGEMVVAARALGASPARIVTRHLLPNLGGLVTALAVLAFAQNLVAEAALSYLGLGAPPPAPTWGRMLYEGQVYYRTAPHLVLAPGLVIVLAVTAAHLLAGALRHHEEAR